jgi:hypothetical protein
MMAETQITFETEMQRRARPTSLGCLSQSIFAV